MDSGWLNNLEILNKCLPFYNIKRFEKEVIGKCEFYFKSLNVLYIEYYHHRKSIGKLTTYEIKIGEPRERNSFTELCLQAFSGEEKIKILNSKSLTDLIYLTPLIVNEKSRRNDPSYNPSAITPDVREKFSEEHQNLIESFKKYKNGEAGIIKVIIAMAKLLYVIRSNIAHSEKTPKGPDIEKTERDEAVCKVVQPLLELLFAIVFNYPNNRLAVYGTLSPGGLNNNMLSKIISNPHIESSGVVLGYINTKNNLPFFNWDMGKDEIEVFVYESNLLPGEFANLDRFEGKWYTRILVPIKINSKFVVGNIYAENIN